MIAYRLKKEKLVKLKKQSEIYFRKSKYKIKNYEAAHNVKVMEAIVKSSKTNKKVFLT